MAIEKKKGRTGRFGYLWAAFTLLWILAGCRGSLASSSTGIQVSTLAPEIHSIQTFPVRTPGITPGLMVVTPVKPTLQIPPAEETPLRVSLTPTAAASDTPQPFQLCSPLAGHELEELPEIISDPYHPPPPGKEERHQGVDFSYYRRGDRSSIQGVPVQSVLAGVTAAMLEDKFPYGNMVILETPIEDLPADLAERLVYAAGESLYILYAHMEQPPQVSLGEAVEACQGLGSVGKSGNAGVTHLHLETRIGPPGQQFASMAYYDLKASEEEKASYLRWRISWDFRHFNPMDLFSYTR